MVGQSLPYPRRGPAPGATRPGRSRRPSSTAPRVESLEGRVLLAQVPTATGTAGGSAFTVGPPVSPQAQGAAFRMVVASQTATLGALGGALARVQAAAADLAARGATAIEQINSGRAAIQVQIAADTQAGDAAAVRRDQAALAASTSAYRRDVQLLARGASQAGQAQHGLTVSVGIEDQAVVTAETDIVNDLFTSLQSVVDTATTTGTAIARRGTSSSAVVVADLDALAAQLVADPGPATPTR
jgi:hypothetical protein